MGLGKQERSEKFAEVLNEFVENNIPEDAEDRDAKSGACQTILPRCRKEAVRNLILTKAYVWTAKNEPDTSHLGHGQCTAYASRFVRFHTRRNTGARNRNSRYESDANEVDGVSFKYKESFYLHYNFPPYSTGETKPYARGFTPRDRPR